MNRIELTDEQSSALDAIIEAPGAWSPLGRIEGSAREQSLQLLRPWANPRIVARWLDGLEAAGHKRATLRALERLGLVEPWPLAQHYGGRSYTLSAIGADYRGVTLAERWAYRRTPERIITAQGTRTVWKRIAFEELVWARPCEAERPVYLPRYEQLGLPLLPERPIEDARQGDPAQDALVAEAAQLIRLFQESCEAGQADPDLLRRAESICEGVSEAMRAAYVFDEATGLPRVVLGKLVPRDARIRRVRRVRRQAS